jgi:hypothetical protein
MNWPLGHHDTGLPSAAASGGLTGLLYEDARGLPSTSAPQDGGCQWNLAPGGYPPDPVAHAQSWYLPQDPNAIWHEAFEQGILAAQEAAGRRHAKVRSVGCQTEPEIERMEVRTADEVPTSSTTVANPYGARMSIDDVTVAGHIMLSVWTFLQPWLNFDEHAP